MAVVRLGAKTDVDSKALSTYTSTQLLVVQERAAALLQNASDDRSLRARLLELQTDVRAELQKRAEEGTLLK